MREFDRITTDPNVANGLPCIRNTGITVSEVVKKITYEKTMDEVLDLYPKLEYEDLVDALAYQLEHFRSLIVSTMADFRSPLSTIIGMSEILSSDIQRLNKDKEQEFISIINKSSKAILDSTHALVEWVGLQAASPYIISVALIEVLRQLSTDVQVVLKYKIAEDELNRIMCDGRQISTLFSLLAQNNMWGRLTLDCVIDIEEADLNNVNFKIQRWFTKPIDFAIFKGEISYPASAISTSIWILRNHNHDLHISPIENGVLFEFNLPKRIED